MAAVLLAPVCGFLFLSDSVSQILFPVHSSAINAVRAARITKIRKDVRKKSAFAAVWSDVANDEPVFAGDVVATFNDSGAVLKLEDANEIVMMSDSEVRFRKAGDAVTADMTAGTFALQIKDSLRAHVAGKVQEFNGSTGEVRVVIRAGDAPTVKVTRGDIRIETPGEVAITGAAVEPDQDGTDVLHLWQLEDFYSLKGREVRPREMPAPVDVKHVLKWEAGGANKFSVQISGNPDFAGERMQLESPGATLALTKAFRGVNYWRVSSDGRTWSSSQRFTVRGSYLDEVLEAPVIQTEPGNAGRAMEAVIRWRGEKNLVRSIVEISTSDDFERGPIRMELVDGLVFRGKFIGPATYFVRARGINADGRLTDFAPAVQIKASH